MQEVEPVRLHVPDSLEQLETECQQVSAQIRIWLDEEWTVLEVHSDLAKAATQVGHAAFYLHDDIPFDGVQACFAVQELTYILTAHLLHSHLGFCQAGTSFM